jgi:hypothetical protein
VGLSTEDAEWYFNTVNVGDPVIVQETASKFLEQCRVREALHLVDVQGTRLMPSLSSRLSLAVWPHRRTCPRCRCWLSSIADQRVWPGDASVLSAGPIPDEDLPQRAVSLPDQA